MPQGAKTFAFSCPFCQLPDIGFGCALFGDDVSDFDAGEIVDSAVPGFDAVKEFLLFSPHQVVLAASEGSIESSCRHGSAFDAHVCPDGVCLALEKTYPIAQINGRNPDITPFAQPGWRTSGFE